ncbi:MAG: NADH-quinone oxidoreductase subunit N [Planctomycetota bacterium]
MTTFMDKLVTLWPEMIMLAGAVACMGVGLASSSAVRRSTPWVAAAAMVAAWVVTVFTPVADHPLGFGGMVPYVKCLVLAMGLILLAVNAGVPEALSQQLDVERKADTSKGFDPAESVSGEFYGFFLLSLTGAMMVASATDLVWLFLALELTSLPTYVMIATSRHRLAAQESAIKYFFLGALSAAVFLYGFALIYGATGFTDFGRIAASVEADVSPLMLLGVVLAVLGLCFKVAAVPMHVYAADVYQGAATPVTAFLAVVPKTAGFVALILVVGLVGWDTGAGGLPAALAYLLAGIAVLTMTIGNVLAIIQSDLKRVLAYSSIAHSGYLMCGLVAGLAPTAAVTEGSSGGVPGGAMGNGVAAVLFYLLGYGMATAGAFAVLACLRPKQDADADDGDGDADTLGYDALSGLWWKRPALAGVMLVSMLSLVGMPPLAGFLGKVYLIGGVFTAGYAVLAVVIVLNSAISAGYYLRIAMVCFFGPRNDAVAATRAPWRVAAGVLTTLAAFALGGYAADGIVSRSHDAVTPGAVEKEASIDATTQSAAAASPRRPSR